MSRVLVIDDSQIIRDLLKDILASHGYEVLEAENADKGHQLIKRKPPDLILLDLDLPDVSGIELCKMLRGHAETRHIPVIMITARAEDQVKGFQAGADDYVKKPFQTDELIERVRAVLRRAQQRSRAPEPPPEPAAPLPPSAPPAALPAAPAEVPAGPPPAGVRTARPAASEEDSPTALLQTLSRALLEPQRLGGASAQPKVAPAFLLVLLGLVNLGAYGAPAANLSPLLVTLLAPLIWGSLVAVLVVVCSICGAGLSWPEGAQLISLAGLPVLLKLSGACVLAIATSLSPFLFSAGPALLFKSPPFLLARLDLFELWSAALLWLLLRKRADGGKPAAAVGALCVWGAALFLLAGISFFKRQS